MRRTGSDPFEFEARIEDPEMVFIVWSGNKGLGAGDFIGKLKGERVKKKTRCLIKCRGELLVYVFGWQEWQKREEHLSRSLSKPLLTLCLFLRNILEVIKNYNEIWSTLFTLI